LSVPALVNGLLSDHIEILFAMPRVKEKGAFTPKSGRTRFNVAQVAPAVAGLYRRLPVGEA
jgi:hypothetical protein